MNETPADQRCESTSVLECGKLRLDPRSSTVYRLGFGVRLGRHEYVILEALMRATGAVVSPDRLAVVAEFGGESGSLSKVRSTIGRLRRKLGHSRFIETIGSEGYRIDAGH